MTDGHDNGDTSFCSAGRILKGYKDEEWEPPCVRVVAGVLVVVPSSQPSEGVRLPLCEHHLQLLDNEGTGMTWEPKT